MEYPKLYDSNQTLIAYLFLLFIFSHKLWDFIKYASKIFFIYLCVFGVAYQALPVAIFLPCHVHNCKYLAFKFHVAVDNVENESTSYSILLAHFKVDSLIKRRGTSDLMYLLKLLNGLEDNTYLRELVSLRVGGRRRLDHLFYSDFCRIEFCAKDVGRSTTALLISKYCRWMIGAIDIRGAYEKIPHLGGGVIVMNHQHCLDICVTATILPLFTKFTLVVKNSLRWPLLASRLCGAHFVETAPGASAQDIMSKGVADKAKEHAKILVYPEGTRNRYASKTQCFLPFKKGPFRAAIASQVPLIPVVTSPYYFAISDKNYFSKGDVITEVLEPISTVGMVDEDTDALLAKVNKLMKDKYAELYRESISKLPQNHPFFEYINPSEDDKNK